MLARIPEMTPGADDVRACYDAVAHEYAKRFADELSHKPLDRELLTRFAAAVRGRGPVCDLGCGPGQTTAFLCDCGVDASGLDLSSKLVREARERRPGVKFEQGDMLALPVADDALAGIVAFYAIVHFSPAELRRAFTEMHRVLKPDGRLLLTFHLGAGLVHVEQFLGRPVELDFMFFTPAQITSTLEEAGFAVDDVIERDPYPDVEYPSRRAYLFARRKGGAIVDRQHFPIS